MTLFTTRHVIIYSHEYENNLVLLWPKTWVADPDPAHRKKNKDPTLPKITDPTGGETTKFGFNNRIQIRPPKTDKDPTCYRCRNTFFFIYIAMRRQVDIVIYKNLFVW